MAQCLLLASALYLQFVGCSQWVKAAVNENVSSRSSWDWVTDNYEVYPGSVANDFGAGDTDKDAKGRTRLNMSDVGDWFVRSDKLFEIYKENGGRDGVTKFGRTLSEHGILPWDRKVNGKTISIRVGLRIPQRDVAFRDAPSTHRTTQGFVGSFRRECTEEEDADEHGC